MKDTTISGIVIANSAKPITLVHGYIQARHINASELARWLDVDMETALDLVHGAPCNIDLYRWVQDVIGLPVDLLALREVRHRWGFDIDYDGTAAILSDIEVEAVKRWVEAREHPGERRLIQ